LRGGQFGLATDEVGLMLDEAKALSAELHLATVILGGGLLRHAGNEAQKSKLLPEIAGGNCCSLSPMPSGNRATTLPISPPPRGATVPAGGSRARKAWYCMAILSTP
jgi:hypothetical protein